MKRFRVFYGGLAGLAAACALGAWFAPVEAGWLAFPWGSIGAGLRVLSLSGSVGNVAACGLYALLCLLPAGIALRDIRHRCPPGLRCGISGTAGRWLGSARCWGLRSIFSSIRGCWPSGWAACRKKLSWPCWGS